MCSEACLDNPVLGVGLSSGLTMSSFVDVVSFSCIVAARRGRSTGRLAVINALGPISAVMASLTKCYITRCGASGSSTTRPLPRLLRSLSSNRCCRVDPNSAWAVLEKAQEKGQTPRQILANDNDRQEFVDLKHQVADTWSVKELDMYLKNTQQAFQDQVQLSITTDPSSYNGEETAVGMVYSWEKDIAAVLPIKVIPRGKQIPAGELDMSLLLAAAVLRRKFERWAAYKEVRALSSQISLVTNGHMTVDSFRLPDSVTARRVRTGEARVLTATNIAIICTMVGGLVVGSLAEMPANLDGIVFPLLVLTLDQGSIGGSWAHFAVGHLQLMLSPRWDAFHRDVNDLKLACLHSCRSVFRRVMLLSTYVFNMSYGPFGKGQFFHEKKEMLSLYVAEHTAHSHHFRMYADLHAASNGYSLSGDAAYRALFDSLPELVTFSSKGPLTKLMRWFAWWNNFHFHAPEFWLTKMVYEYYLGGQNIEGEAVEAVSFLAESDETPEAQIRKLKAQVGGFQLAHRLMTQELFDNARVLYSVGQPVWDVHTNRAKTVKTPAHGLRYLSKQTLGGWRTEISALAHTSFRNMENLGRWGLLGASSIAPYFESLCTRAFFLGVHVMNARAWSSVLEFDMPPMKYASLASSNDQVRIRCAETMRVDWANLLRLEAAALVNAQAAELRASIPAADATPNRLLYMLFERHGFDANCHEGQKYLRALLQSFTDSRLVEEHHQVLRDLERASRHNVTGKLARMQSCRRGAILEGRGIPTVKVTKEQFVSSFFRKPTISKKTWLSHGHKLPAHWERLLQPGKTWTSPTPQSARVFAAAMAWLSYFNEQNLQARQDVTITSARLTCAVPNMHLLRRLEDDALFFVLESAKWGALSLTVEVARQNVYVVTGEVAWIHVLALEGAFVVVPTRICSPAALVAQYPDLPLNTGITLTRAGADQSMLQALFSDKVTLPHDDLLLLARTVAVEHNSQQSRATLLAVLASYVFADGTVEHKTSCVDLAVSGTRGADDDMADLADEDVEAALELLDDDNRDDFKDFKQAVKRKSVKRKIAEVRAEATRTLAKAKAKSKAELQQHKQKWKGRTSSKQWVLVLCRRKTQQEDDKLKAKIKHQKHPFRGRCETRGSFAPGR